MLKRHPNLFFLEEIHTLENLRGIPKEINRDIHLSKIRIDWNSFIEIIQVLQKRKYKLYD